MSFRLSSVTALTFLSSLVVLLALTNPSPRSFGALEGKSQEGMPSFLSFRVWFLSPSKASPPVRSFGLFSIATRSNIIYLGVFERWIPLALPDCSALNNCSGKGLCVYRDTCLCLPSWNGDPECSVSSCLGFSPITGKLPSLSWLDLLFLFYLSLLVFDILLNPAGSFTLWDHPSSLHAVFNGLSLHVAGPDCAGVFGGSFSLVVFILVVSVAARKYRKKHPPSGFANASLSLKVIQAMALREGSSTRAILVHLAWEGCILGGPSFIDWTGRLVSIALSLAVGSYFLERAGGAQTW